MVGGRASDCLKYLRVSFSWTNYNCILKQKEQKGANKVVMFDIPLSIVAWISVVLVQAVVHYVVFGARRARIQHEEDLVLEESLSLATNDSSLDTADDTASLADALTMKDCGYSGAGIPITPNSPVVLRDELFACDGEEPDFLNLLSQTGTDLLKVSKRE